MSLNPIKSINFQCLLKNHQTLFLYNKIIEDKFWLTFVQSSTPETTTTSDFLNIFCMLGEPLKIIILSPLSFNHHLFLSLISVGKKL